jgi:acyl-CoA reductase-like NAD-dependent aldehyde dehydrogenase
MLTFIEPATEQVLAELPEGDIDAAVARAKATFPAWRVVTPESRGPLISAAQRDEVAGYVTGDSPVAIRGKAPDRPGFWYPPTVLCPVGNDDRAAREEIFGPVAVVIPFDNEDEAVRIANDTIYGLFGSIWTLNCDRALRVARAIDTGALSVNSNTSVRVTTPFGGFKQSGLGRELGPHALDYYTELKNVFFATT